MRRTWTVIALVAAVALAGCGGDDDGEAGGEAAAAGDAGAGVVVSTAETDLGEVLVDGEGRTLYLFDSDPEGGTACTDGCAENWPPLEGPAEASGGADAALLGTIDRPEGGTQVTYAGHPLYHYAADAAAGDVAGQGVGDVWWVVAPDGEAIRDAEAARADTPAY